MRQCFTKEAEDGRARTGVLVTAHGPVETPVFMPVATQGSVKARSQADLESLGVRAILSNSYHLYLRPGAEVLAKAGGLHSFMDFKGAILTDSGGYQVFSLADLRSISEEGVTFRSHLDGSRHALTPESVIRFQARIGSDMWTTLDECPPYPCTEKDALRALERTENWSAASRKVFDSLPEKVRAGRLFFPVTQGSMFPALRRRAMEHILEVGCDGISLGGFSVGEPKEMTWDVLGRTLEHVPDGVPRYLMGMGAPQDLWEAVERGVDMMDCVWPTRIARNGQVMTQDGRMNIKNTPFQKDFAPLDPECACPVCRRYSRAYLSHLFRSRELSAHRLLTIHNVHFNLSLMRRIRRAAAEGVFRTEKARFMDRYFAADR